VLTGACFLMRIDLQMIVTKVFDEAVRILISYKDMYTLLSYI
jgi:hypothetical protein